MRDNVYISIATQPHRIHTCEKTIEGLLPQLAENDRIFLYLNGFDKLPEFVANEKITALGFKGKDLGASGKFKMAGKVKGFYLVADDDLLYGKDHVNYLVHMIELYKRQAVIGVHATTYPSHPVKSYYHGAREIVYANGGSSKDKFVHMLATNGLGFHTDTLPEITLKNFPEKRMCDPFFAKYCIENNIPQVVLTHAANWIRTQETSSDSGAIWKQVAANDSKQTEIINSIKDFRLVTCPFINRQNVDMNNLGSLEETEIIEIFKLLKSGTILEFGSGKGTGELAKFYNMISIENDTKWMKEKSKYIHAPIKDGFYDLDNVEIPEYDLLIIDGPNSMFTDFKRQIGRKQFRSYFMRYESKFDLSKPILVDDVDREDEKILMNALAARTGREPKIFQGKRKQFAII